MNLLKKLTTYGCKILKQSDCSTTHGKAHAQELCFGISECCVGKKFYCCVFHHPLRPAGATLNSYTIDEVHIVSNKRFNTDKKTYTDGTSHITLRLVKSEPCDMQIVLDKKIYYRLPIYDASESWEFVFSNSPIVPNEYLDGYHRLSKNKFVAKF